MIDANAAEKAKWNVDPNASDEAIADIVANYLLSRFSTRSFFHLSIFHDVRPSTAVRLARVQKRNPHYAVEPPGPCPLAYDWSYKNMVGISTRDCAHAREWIIAATLAGYGVFRSPRRNDSGIGAGSLTDIRKRAADRVELLARRRELAK